MKINGQNPVNTAKVVPYFQKKGLSLDLLSKCNAQSFKSIGGYGEGYFLFTSDQVIDDSDIVTFEVTDSFELDEFGAPLSVEFGLYVLNKLTLHHPDQTSIYLYALHTAEEKYVLQSVKVTRNYNLIKRNEITDESFENYYDPDATPKTLEAIITDIVNPATVTYNAPALTPLEVNIQGMSALEAIDRLCAAHGLFWTMRDGDVNIFANTTIPEPSYDKIVDIRKPITADNDVEIIHSHPVIAPGTQLNSRYPITSSGSSDISLLLYMPYMPAIFKAGDDYSDTPVNNAELVAFNNTIAPYIRAALEIEDFYMVHEHYNLAYGATGPFSSTFCFTLTYADLGAGPRTFYSSVKYPFPNIPQPYTFDGTSSSTSPTIYAKFTLTADMTGGEGDTATASVDATNDPAMPSTITVTNPLYAKAYTGAKGLAIKVTESDGITITWIVMEVQRPSTFVLAALNVHPDSSAFPNVRFAADPREADASIKTSPAPVVISSYPFNFVHSSVNPATMTGLIPNPYHFTGQVDDLALLRWSDALEEYHVVDIYYGRQQLMVVRYTEDRPLGMDETIDSMPMIPLSQGNWPTLEALPPPRDIFNVALNAKVDDIGIARWIPLTDTSGEWYLLESTHKATKVMATVYADFDATDVDFQVTPDTLNGLDGDDISGTTTVKNIYHWSGTAGKVIRIEWNGIFGKGYWQPCQMDWECPT